MELNDKRFNITPPAYLSKTEIAKLGAMPRPFFKKFAKKIQSEV
jgi:hypothetical protein